MGQLTVVERADPALDSPRGVDDRGPPRPFVGHHKPVSRQAQDLLGSTREVRQIRHVGLAPRWPHMQLHRSLPGENDVRQLAALLVQGEGIMDGGFPGRDPAHLLEQRRRSQCVAAGRHDEHQHRRRGQDRT